MTRDELEFAISQYHDGSLPLLERNSVEEILATDSDARAVLAEYQKLDSMLTRSPALALPTMNWSAVHARISEAVAKEEAPTQTIRLGTWTRWAGSFAAVAAAVAIVLSVTLRSSGPSPSASKPAGNPVLQIAVGPSAGSTPQAVASIPQVAVGPSPEVAQASWQQYAADDGILTRPARVIIAGDVDTAQDTGGSSLLYQ